jgi:3-oxoacyl-[acyl-carrier protein] reductase
MKDVVLLTGHSRGLGKSILDELEQDYAVIGISSHELDLSKTCHTACYKIPEKTSHLVYNAGIAYDDLVTNIDLVQLQNMLNVNVISAMILTRHVIRDMLLYGIKGSITFISSISAHTGYKGLSRYGATKGALEAFSRGIAREWGGMGIRSNCVSPGFIQTDMTAGLSDANRDRVANRTALKSLASKLDVAKAVRFCIENQSLTGQTLIIDSGSL